MRYVPVSCLREGMTLSRPLFGKNFEVMLSSGSSLKENYIKRIVELGYPGVYIDDDLSKDIEVVSVINDDLKRKSVKGLKNIFILSENCSSNDPEFVKSINDSKDLVTDIVDDIIINKNLMVNLVDLKVFDDYTFHHSANVAVLSIVLGVALGLNKVELYKLGLGALFHDIGKVFTPQEILNKRSKLTNSEFNIMKEHSESGYKYLKDQYDFPTTSYIGILQHHEKYDGSGYPHGLSNERISLFARIISVADVYDALTSDRPYRKAMLPSEAMEYIMGGSGTLFDPEIVSVFTRKVAPFPLGTCVTLSNGTTGIVVENFEDQCLRPKLKDIESSPGQPIYIDLKNDPVYSNVTIVDVAKM